jgi:hypothetical protein
VEESDTIQFRLLWYRSQRHGAKPRPGTQAHSGQALPRNTPIWARLHLRCEPDEHVLYPGVGVRWPGAIFNSDRYSMGVETPIGISCYGFYMLGAWFVTPLNFGTGWFNWIVECPDVQYAPDFELQRTQDPKRYCLPIYEAIHESPYVLCQMERSIQQNVLPLQCCAMYLHGGTQMHGVAPPKMMRVTQCSLARSPHRFRRHQT